MNQKGKYQRITRPMKDDSSQPEKSTPPVIKKTSIRPTDQAADMDAKAEIEMARQHLRTALTPPPAPTPATPAVIKHVWTKEDTYADLAFKYYGSIKEPYWRLIYNHNKHIIGDHPNNIRVGLEIEIPPLPEELKKK